MRTKLVEVKAGAKAAVIDATETLQYQITQEAKQEQDLVSATAGLEVIARNSTSRLRSSSRTTPRTVRDAERRAEDRRAAPRQGSSRARSPDAESADRGPGAIVDHHQCRPGGPQRPGDHAHRARGFGA